MSRGRIDHSAHLSKAIADMFMNTTFSDVIIQAGDELFPAHSNILASQSAYFEEVFYGENKKEIAIDVKTKAATFRIILRYFYTGQLEWNAARRICCIAEVIRLATHLRLNQLKKDVISDICGTLLGIEEIPRDILQLLDQEAALVINTETFQTLSSERVRELLSRDTFYVEKELDVFRAVMRWGRGRPAEECKAILPAVRLPLVPQSEIFSEVRPTNVYSKLELYDAIEQQQQQKQHMSASTVRPRQPTTIYEDDLNDAGFPPSGVNVTTGRLPRVPEGNVPGAKVHSKLDSAGALQEHVHSKVEVSDTIEQQQYKRQSSLRPTTEYEDIHNAELPTPGSKPPGIPCLFGENVSASNLGATVLSGYNPELLLTDEAHAYSLSSGFTWHKVKPLDLSSNILVKFDRTYMINTVKLHLQDKDKRLVSYFMEVATEKLGPWTGVVDNRRYKCRGRQLLHFDAIPVQYVRLVGTACSMGDVFAVVSLQCWYTDTPLPMSRGVIEPIENQALRTRGALVLQGRSRGASMLGGVHTDLYTFTQGQGNPYTIEVLLPQPVFVGSLRYKLLNECAHQFKVDVSLDRCTWFTVADEAKQDFRSWTALHFTKLPFTFIKFTHTGCLLNIAISYLECPSPAE